MPGSGEASNAVHGIATVLRAVVVVVLVELLVPPEVPATLLASVVSRTVYAMQPVSRSSTTSLITPTSAPSALRIFEPIIWLLWT
jgi:hypothetical protein